MRHSGNGIAPTNNEEIFLTLVILTLFSRLCVEFKHVTRVETSLGLKSAKDLSFGRREGFLARYERANALPPRPRVGRAGMCPFSRCAGVSCCCTPEGPPTRREVLVSSDGVVRNIVVLSNEAS